MMSEGISVVHPWSAIFPGYSLVGRKTADMGGCCHNRHRRDHEDKEEVIAALTKNEHSAGV